MSRGCIHVLIGGDTEQITGMSSMHTNKELLQRIKPDRSRILVMFDSPELVPFALEMETFPQTFFVL